MIDITGELITSLPKHPQFVYPLIAKKIFTNKNTANIAATDK